MSIVFIWNNLLPGIQKYVKNHDFKLFHKIIKHGNLYKKFLKKWMFFMLNIHLTQNDSKFFEKHIVCLIVDYAFLF